ncbi:MAG: hypothetical protein ACKVU0_06790 [Saprospiraceae bacterium]
MKINALERLVKRHKRGVELGIFFASLGLPLTTKASAVRGVFTAHHGGVSG